METYPAPSQQWHAHARLPDGIAPFGAAPQASRTRYTCTAHPDTLSKGPNVCPQCGRSLLPVRQAIARAARALRSLSEVTRELRLHQL